MIAIEPCCAHKQSMTSSTGLLLSSTGRHSNKQFFPDTQLSVEDARLFSVVEPDEEEEPKIKSPRHSNHNTPKEVCLGGGVHVAPCVLTLCCITLQACMSVLSSWLSRRFMSGVYVYPCWWASAHSCTHHRNPNHIHRAILFPVVVTVYVTWWFLTFFDNFFSVRCIGMQGGGGMLLICTGCCVIVCNKSHTITPIVHNH